MNLSKFEWKKITTDKTNFFGILIILILLLPPLFGSSTNMYENRIQELQLTLEMGERATEELKKIPLAAQALKDTEETNYLLRILIDAYTTGQSKEILKAEYDYERKILKDTESGSLIGVPLIEQKKKISTLEYLMKNDLEIVNNYQSQVPSIIFLYKILTGLVPITIIFMIISLLFANMYSSEKRKDNIYFLNSMPVSLYKISLNKIITNSTFAVLTLLFGFLIIFLLCSFKNGVGNLNYPLAYTVDGVNVSIISMSTFILKSFILMFTFIFFLSALSFLVSIFTGSILVNAVILISTVLISDSTYLKNDAIKNFAHFLPFSYVDASNVVTFGSYYKPLINSSITFGNGILYLTLYSIILILISFFIIYKKKKI